MGRSAGRWQGGERGKCSDFREPELACRRGNFEKECSHRSFFLGKGIYKVPIFYYESVILTQVIFHIMRKSVFRTTIST